MNDTVLSAYFRATERATVTSDGFIEDVLSPEYHAALFSGDVSHSRPLSGETGHWQPYPSMVDRSRRLTTLNEHGSDS